MSLYKRNESKVWLRKNLSDRRALSRSQRGPLGAQEALLNQQGRNLSNGTSRETGK